MARAVFDEVDDALGEKLSDLIFNGPAEELNLTKNVQPAVFAVSMAMYLGWKASPDALGPPPPDFVAGHSLGEYSALCAAGSVGVGAMARLLRKRGELMQDAAPSGVGAMAAIIGVGDVPAICADAAAAGICEVANDNSPGQTVISGYSAAVEKAVELAKGRGAKIAKVLSVSVPAHSGLMRPAVEGIRAALDEIEWKSPICPLISNKTAGVMTDTAEIKESLVYQLTHGVRWRESVLNMPALGIDEVVEIGPGNVLTGLVKRIAPELNCYKLEL
jgi:[acyl-carrier-protein] S-malonyltransferase